MIDEWNRSAKFQIWCGWNIYSSCDEILGLYVAPGSIRFTRFNLIIFSSKFISVFVAILVAGVINFGLKVIALFGYRCTESVPLIPSRTKTRSNYGNWVIWLTSHTKISNISFALFEFTRKSMVHRVYWFRINSFRIKTKNTSFFWQFDCLFCSKCLWFLLACLLMNFYFRWQYRKSDGMCITLHRFDR